MPGFREDSQDRRTFLTKSRLRSIITLIPCREGFTVLPDAVSRRLRKASELLFFGRIGSSADEATTYQARRKGWQGGVSIAS